MRKAPEGALWRPSVLPHLVRTWVLVLERDGHQVGSVGPAPGGKWMNRDTGEVFIHKDDAMSSVEKYISN